jgi:hypothetical protein
MKFDQVIRPVFALFLVVLLLAGGSPAAAKDTWAGVDRIIAIGDIHGDYEQFVRLLRSSGLIDDNDDWAGGQTHFVQTGDVPDRGADTRKVMDLLMKLEKQAKEVKGYVHALIGNHEAMNMYGDLRYVHPGEFAAFENPKSSGARQGYYKQHVSELKRHPPPGGLPEFGPDHLRKWENDHPLGWFEHRSGFGAFGRYGRWILKHNAVIQINDTIFLHGGIGPKYAAMSIGDMNQRILMELRDFSKLKGGIVMDPQGPLWYRGLALHDERTETAHLETVLGQHQAKRIVMGHTVTEGTVMPRLRGRAVLIDVGLSRHYGGRLACLLIEGGVPYVLHRREKIPLPADDSPSSLLSYLEKAAAADPRPSPLRRKIQQLQAELQAGETGR